MPGNWQHIKTGPWLYLYNEERAIYYHAVRNNNMFDLDYHRQIINQNATLEAAIIYYKTYFKFKNFA